MATSEPRRNDSLPASASEERNFRSARIRSASIDCEKPETVPSNQTAAIYTYLTLAMLKCNVCQFQTCAASASLVRTAAKQQTSWLFFQQARTWTPISRTPTHGTTGGRTALLRTSN